jgi:hypothetical protein
MSVSILNRPSIFDVVEPCQSACKVGEHLVGDAILRSVSEVWHLDHHSAHGAVVINDFEPTWMGPAVGVQERFALRR